MKLTISTLILATALGVLALEQRYSLTHIQVGPIHGVARTDRLTGDTQICWPGVGWRPAATPLYQISAALDAEATPATTKSIPGLDELAASVKKPATVDLSVFSPPKPAPANPALLA